MYVKDKRASIDPIKLVFSVLISLLVLGIVIYAMLNWVIPRLKAQSDCESMGAYWYTGTKCPTDKIGIRQTKLEGVTGKHDSKTQICCFGKPVDEDNKGSKDDKDNDVTLPSTSLTKEENCVGEICYKFDVLDVVMPHTPLPQYKYGDPFYLNPNPRNETPANGMILPAKEITFSSILENKGCCIMQIGGINSDTHTYFEGKLPKDNEGFIRLFSNITDGGKCVLETKFDFANLNDKYFNFDFWKDSNSSLDNSERQKAMFKIDVLYTGKETSCERIEGEDNEIINFNLIVGSISSLIDIKELDAENIFYPAEEETGTPTTGGGLNLPIGPEIEYTNVNFKFLTRKNIGSLSLNANNFESFNNNIYSGSDADVCEVYCVDKANNPCNKVRIIYSFNNDVDCESLDYENPDLQFDLEYSDELKFFTGPKTLRYYCIAYSLDDNLGYQTKKVKSNCAKIYHILPDSSFPFVTNYQNSCDTGIYECENIQNSFVCDNGINIFSNYNGEGVLNYYRSSYCINQITDCYYDTWKKQCFSCETPPFSCKGYASRNTCEKDPCEWVGDDGCFWDEEKEKCSACVKNCNVFESKTMCDKKENICGIEDECFWEENYFLIFHAGGACNSCCSAITEKDCNKQDSKCASGCDWIDETCKLGV